MKPITRIIFIKIPLIILVAAALNIVWILMIHLVGLMFSWSFISFLLTHWWALVLWIIIPGIGYIVFSIQFINIITNKKK
jgi:hypothetical protein